MDQTKIKKVITQQQAYKLLEALNLASQFVNELERQGETMVKIAPVLRISLQRVCVKLEQTIKESEG